MEQIVKARIVLAHADSGNTKTSLQNELILYDFPKSLIEGDNRTELRFRIGNGKAINGIAEQIDLNHLRYYESKPVEPEAGDIWYNETEETFYLQVNKKEIKLSHVIENIEDGLGKNSIQTTDSSTAGSMCFRFDSTKPHTQNEFYLLMTDEQKQKEFNVAGKKFSMKLDNNFDYAGVATSLVNGVLTVQTLTATHNGAPAVPGTAGVGALAIDKDSFLFFPEYPELGTDILGEGAIALGINNKAQSNASFAEGKDTVSAGQYAHAEGRRTYAIGYSSHAEGIDTKAIGQRSHAEGDNTIAEGYGSHAEGQKTEAIGRQSHAEGAESVAEGDQAHAEGLNTWAKGQGAHGEGLRGAAIGDGAHVEGRAVTEPFDENGNLKPWAKDAGLSIAEGEASHVEGLHNHTGANARAAHAEGEITEATGVNAHAEGNNTYAFGNYSHAEGQGTQATKASAHAEGGNTIASGERAHAEGNGTQATANNTHAEGLSTKATDVNAHAEGQSTTASSKNSHAEGYNTEAKGEGSHAEGESTRASGKNQHVQGRYNIEDIEATEKKPEGKYAHVVGNGTSSQRSNAHTLDWEGNAWYAGDIKAEGIIEGEEVKSPRIEALDAFVINEDNKYQTLITSEAIQTTGTIAGKELNINLKTVIDSNRNIIGQTITSQTEIKGQELNINDKATIDENGNGYFNSLAIGGDKSFAIRYRGQVKTTSDLEGENREGDFVSTTINPNLPETFLGFYIPGDEPFTGDIKLTENGIEFYEVNNIFRKLLLYLTNTHLEYVNDIPEGTNDISNYSLNGPGFSRLVLTFSFDTGRVLQLDLGTILSQNKDKGPYTQFFGEWLSPIDDIYANFKENNLNVLMYAIPNKEDIDLTENPELEKYKKLSRSQENLYIYLNKKWVKLTNQTAFNGGSSIGKLPIIGYEDFCKYQINDENDILACLNQAISENKTVYIMPGHYNSDKYWSIPDIDDLHFIGIGKVTLDFKLQPKGTEFYNETISQSWTWENIIFNKEVTLSVLKLSESTNYQRSAKILNCQFNNEVDICDDHGTQNYFENCIFNDNINNSENYGSNDSDLNIEYINCIFNINKWSIDINKILASKIEYCTFYFPIEQKDVVFGRAFTNNGGFNSSNLFTNNTYYLMGVETRFLTPNVWVENLSVKHSSFPWKPVLEPINKNEEGLVCKIDRDTCYINNNSLDNEVLIQNKNINLIQSHQVKEKNMLHNYDNDDMAPSFILLNGEEITPTGDYLEAYNEWKKDKSFSYLDGVNNSLILGHNIYANGSNFNITGTNHLVTGVSHTVEGQANVIGGMDVDELPDIQIIANHAEGINNILPPHTKDTASPILMGRHIEGVGNIGNQLDGSHVQGKYNEEDVTDTLIHIVGNGTSNSKRSNAHTLDKEGNAWYQGNITLGEEKNPVLYYVDKIEEGFINDPKPGMIQELKTELIPKDWTLQQPSEFDCLEKDLITDEYFLRADTLLSIVIESGLSNFLGRTPEDSDTIHISLRLNIVNEENSYELVLNDITKIELDNDNSTLKYYFDSIAGIYNESSYFYEELDPTTNEEIIRIYHSFLNNQESIVIKGLYYENDRYDPGETYLYTSNNYWKKLKIVSSGNNNNDNDDKENSDLKSGPIIIQKPINATVVGTASSGQSYQFELDLSKYGIKPNQIINVACIGAGGGGAGATSAIKGGAAGKAGEGSSSNSGGAAGSGYGAGGGGSAITNSSYYGSSGASGYVAMQTFALDNNLKFTVQIGKGGAGGGGSSNSTRKGYPGGSTKFLDLEAAGGQGGTYASSNAKQPVGGNNGIFSVNGKGANGANGWVPSNYDLEKEIIQPYGVMDYAEGPTYSGDGAIFIWY